MDAGMTNAGTTNEGGAGEGFEFSSVFGGDANNGTGAQGNQETNQGGEGTAQGAGESGQNTAGAQSAGTTGGGQQQGHQQAGPSADEIAAKVAAAMNPGQGEKKYTREELDKMFNVFQPQMDLVQAIREGDEAAATKAMAQLRDGLIKQADTMTQVRLKAMRESLISELSPGLSAAQRAESTRQEQEFYSEHSDLKGREELVKTVFNAMKSEGASFKSRAEASKALADRVRKLGGLPAPTAGSGGGQSSNSSNNNNNASGDNGRPANISTGGSGAAANTGGGSASSGGNVFKEVFG